LPEAITKKYFSFTTVIEPTDWEDFVPAVQRTGGEASSLRPVRVLWQVSMGYLRNYC